MKTLILKISILLTIFTSFSCKKGNLFNRASGNCDSSTFFTINVYDTMNNYLRSETMSSSNGITTSTTGGGNEYGGFFFHDCEIDSTWCATGNNSGTSTTIISMRLSGGNNYYANIIEPNGYKLIQNKPLLPGITHTYTINGGFINGSIPHGEIYYSNDNFSNWEKVKISGSYKIKII